MLTEQNSTQNRPSGEQHSDGVPQCFTPKCSPKSQIARAQLFENTLELEELANFSKCTIEIRRANLKSVARNKTVGRTKGTIPILGATMETDVAILSTEAFPEQFKENFNIDTGSTPMNIFHWEQIFCLFVSESSDCYCLAVLLHLNADTTARKRLNGVQQTHRKPLTWGELRVSSSLTVKTKVLGGTKDLTDEIKAELMTVGAPWELWNSMIKAVTGGHQKFPPHTETRRLYECVFVGLELDVLQGADYIAAALTQTLVYRQLGLGLEICVQRMVFMSEHKQYPIHQDHRDHLRIESLDPRMMQPSWGELNAFPLVATGSAESLLHMNLANRFLWRWGLRFGAAPSFLNSHSWINKFLQPTLNDVFGGGLKFLGIQHLKSRGFFFSEEVLALGLVFGLSNSKRRKAFNKCKFEVLALGLGFELSNSKGRKAFNKCKFKEKHDLYECLKQIPVDGLLTQDGITILDVGRVEDGV